MEVGFIFICDIFIWTYAKKNANHFFDNKILLKIIFYFLFLFDFFIIIFD